jgi:hypothetical protein
MTRNQQEKRARALVVVGIVLLLPFVPYIVIGALQLYFRTQSVDDLSDLWPGSIWWVGVLGLLALFAAAGVSGQDPDWEATLDEPHRMRLGTLAFTLEGELTRLADEELARRARLLEEEITRDLRDRKWAAGATPELRFETIQRGSVILHFTVYLLAAKQVVTTIKDFEETIDDLSKFLERTKSIAKC